MSVRARQEIECRIVLALIRSLIAADYFISINNGEDKPTRPSQDVEAIARLMMACDEETLIVSKKGSGNRFDKVGWFELVYGNDGHDVIHNCTGNLVPHMAATEALSDYYAEGVTNSDSSVVMARVLAEQAKERQDLRNEAPGSWTYGAWVCPVEDPRHVGQALIPKSKKHGVADVHWEENEIWSFDVPLEALKLVHRNSYTVTISEYQRERILNALSTNGKGLRFAYDTKDGTGGGAFDTERREMEVLVEMLNALPEEDAKLQPGCTHGFCP
jgi:hypothetical protein